LYKTNVCRIFTQLKRAANIVGFAFIGVQSRLKYRNRLEDVYFSCLYITGLRFSSQNWI